MRNRKVNATGKENEVLLDENLVECKLLGFLRSIFSHWASQIGRFGLSI